MLIKGEDFMDSRYINKIRYNGGLPKSSYLNDLPLIKFLNLKKSINFTKDVTFFIGENGTGKSTIIEAIAANVGFNSEGGSKHFNFSTNDDFPELAEYITIIRSAYPKDGYFLRAESFYNVATNIDEIGVTGYGERSLHHQSHGESFLSLVQNRFCGKGLYILDEPESALSPIRQMTLMIEINNLVKDNSQFIIATHSPILLSYPNATIYEITSTGINQISYKETEIYQLYKQFIENPEQMLKHLLTEESSQ